MGKKPASPLVPGKDDNSCDRESTSLRTLVLFS